MPDKFRRKSSTNIIEINESTDSLLEKVFTDGQLSGLALDLFTVTQAKRDNGKKLSSGEYFKRLHGLIGKELRKKLDIQAGTEVQYDTAPLSNEKFLVLYVTNALNVSDEHVDEVLDELDAILDKVDDKIHRRVLGGVLSLVAKVAVIEAHGRTVDLQPQFYNSELLLSPLFNGLSKATPYVSALHPSFFFSEQDELIINLSTVSYQLEKSSDEYIHHSSGECNYLLKADKTHYSVIKKVRATKTKRPFYMTKERFSQSRLFAMSFILREVLAKFDKLGIKYTHRLFNPQHEVDSFVILDNEAQKTHNLIYIVDTQNALTKEETLEGYSHYVSRFAEAFDAREVISLKQYDQLRESKTPITFVFINATANECSKSIEYYNKALLQKLTAEHKLGDYPSFNNTMQAYERQLADYDQGVESGFDPYTEIKISLLKDAMNSKFPIHVHQGIEVNPDDIKTLLKREKEDEKNRAEGKPTSGGMIASSKVQKMLTEIILKEVVYSDRTIEASKRHGLADGQYSVSYIRHPREQNDNELLHGKIGLEVKNGQFHVVSKRIERTLKDAVVKDSPYLAVAHKLYNNSFYIHCHTSGHTMTSYQSIRTPKIFGNANMDLVALWDHSKTTGDFMPIGRKTGEQDCVAPFYILPTRGKRDELVLDNAKEFHHVFVEDRGQEVVVLVTNATGPKSKIEKQSLPKNIIVWDDNGKKCDWRESQLLGSYLNGHTYNIVSLKESAKTTIFTKLAKIIIES